MPATANSLSTERFSVLVVDDESAFLETMSAMVEDRYDATMTTSPTHALRLLERRATDVVVSDWQMPVMNGMEFFAAVRKIGFPMGFLLMTGKAEQFRNELLERDRKMLGMLAKPFAPDELFARIDQLARLAIMKRTVDRLRH